MNLFFWKNNSHIDTFAKKLADDFFSTVTPDGVDAFFASKRTEQPDAASTEKSGKKPAKTTQQALHARQKQTDRQIQDLALKIAQFKTQQKLGIYGKARLHMMLKERLTELGFNPDSVQALNRMLLLSSP